MDYSVLPALILFAVCALWYLVDTILIFRCANVKHRWRRALQLSGGAVFLVFLALPGNVLFQTISIGFFDTPLVFLLIFLSVSTIGFTWYLGLVEEMKKRREKAEVQIEIVQTGIWPPPPMRPDGDETEKLTSERHKA